MAREPVSVNPLVLVGCEPERLESPDGEIGLSEKVAAAVPGAVSIVMELIRQLIEDQNRA
jgi:hypothetical protein